MKIQKYKKPSLSEVLKEQTIKSDRWETNIIKRIIWRDVWGQDKYS